MCVGAVVHKGQKMESDQLELELQEVEQYAIICLVFWRRACGMTLITVPLKRS